MLLQKVRRIYTTRPLAAFTVVVWLAALWAMYTAQEGVSLLFAAAAIAITVLALRRGRHLARRQQDKLRFALASADTRNRELERFRQLAQSLLSGTSLAALQHEVALATAELLQDASSGVSIVVEEGRFLRVVAATGGLANTRGMLLPVEQSLLGWAVLHGEPLLVDDVDVRFTRSSAAKPLRKAGVPLGVFNPPFVPARLNSMHLRNHRKILVVDGAVGFTGGMNVDRRYWRPEAPDEAYRDLHFRLRGPIVAQLAEVFDEDWQFATGETLRGAPWFVPLEAAGEVLARAIDDGPDDPDEPLRWSIVSGLNQAQRSVKILTPYFVPDSSLITGLDVAAMRGVDVDIVLPAVSDLPHVQWAVHAQLWQVLERGCRVWSSPGAFDHSKLMVVDGAWTLLGSANWDARSLRLNFELNLEVYSVEFGAHMEGLVQARIGAARAITLAQVDGRPLPVKLRDGVARLFAPFL